MRRENPSLALLRLCPVAVAGFLFAAMFVLDIQAQPAIESERSSGTSSLLVTNLSQLSKILDSSSRVIADVRLDVLVCSASRPEIGVVVVKDETGSEILELGPRSVPIVAGDTIHIESRRCFLRKREIGIEITRTPELDNDGIHGVRTVTAVVHLSAGLHAFQLDYFNYLGPFALELTCRLPDGSVQSADRFLVRPSGGGVSESNMVAGVNANYYEGEWLNVPDFAPLQPVKTVTTTNLNPMIGSRKDLFGIRFKGLFSAPMDGNYSFNLVSDDGSLLFLDGPDVPLTTISHQDVPSPAVTPFRASTTDSEASQWISVEGRVVFASVSGRGLRFELQSPPNSIWVTVADAKELDVMRLLNSRIRVRGISRTVMAPNRDRMLGELAVATSDDITIQEDSSRAVAASGVAPTLLTVGKIQGLSNEEAARHLPVRIQGVVTSISPPIFRYMSVQDETRGIFVRLSSSVKSSAVVGQLCEVVGYTDAGDFAPVLVAENVNIIGKGRMPSPLRPTGKEIINGSMDIQWVELQGLVTSVHSNSLALLLPEGELNVEVGGYSESHLRIFESAVISLRGVVFAAWNTNRTVQVGHLLLRNVNIGVDVPAPSDPFNIPLKSWSELYQFDSRATPFQRVKVRGTVIFADSRRVYLMDNSRGISISPVAPIKLRFGEQVEAVGYPDISGPAPLLREAILRKTGQTDDPAPLILDGGELMQNKVDSMLVRISATLVGIHTEPDSRVLEMNADGHLFLARMPDTKEPVSLRIGSQLALTGVYVGKTMTWSEGGKPGGFELLLSSASQLTVLSQPSWWTPRRLLFMVGLLFVILVLAAVWISLLHRLVEQRTELLQKETREREVAERERTLETERSRIARDLHDDLGSSLTEISVLAVKGQRLRTLDELTTSFRAIAAKARGLVTALDIIVWAVDPKDNSLESVADYLSDFASEYLSHSGITCRFDIPVELPLIVLDGRLRHGLLLAVKETLNNVERHAQATEMEFRMAVAENQLEIVISDNGKGFDTKTKHRGNGLKNLPLRLAKLGGRYNIKSSMGNGTIVTIGLRLSRQTETMPGSDQA
jgi:signal transduction histidine kinase